MNESTEPPVLLARLNRDHAHLASVLQVFDEQYQAFDSEDGPDYELLRDILDYVQAFPDAVHHPAEDILFDHMVHSGTLSPDEIQFVEDNRAQHEVIIKATKDLAQMIEHIVAGGIVGGAALKLKMSEYLSQQHRHMRFENEHLFPLAEAKLEAADWEYLEARLKLVEDPLFDAQQAHYDALRQYITGA